MAKILKIKQFIINYPWYPGRPLIVTRPHSDHETNEERQLTSLGRIITGVSSSDPSSQDSVLFQLKIHIASFFVSI